MHCARTRFFGTALAYSRVEDVYKRQVTIPAVRKSTCRRIGSGIEKVYDTISAIVSPNAPRNPPQLKIVDSRTDKPYPDRFMIG